MKVETKPKVEPELMEVAEDEKESKPLAESKPKEEPQLLECHKLDEESKPLVDGKPKVENKLGASTNGEIEIMDIEQ